AVVDRDRVRPEAPGRHGKDGLAPGERGAAQVAVAAAVPEIDAAGGRPRARCRGADRGREKDRLSGEGAGERTGHRGRRGVRASRWRGAGGAAEEGAVAAIAGDDDVIAGAQGGRGQAGGARNERGGAQVAVGGAIEEIDAAAGCAEAGECGSDA